MTDFSFSLKEKLEGVQVGFNSRRLHHPKWLVYNGMDRKGGFASD